MALADPPRAFVEVRFLAVDVLDLEVDRDRLVRDPPFGLVDVRVAMLHTVTTYVTCAPHATRMVSYSTVANAAIIIMSSCSRLWQWKTYGPV